MPSLILLSEKRRQPIQLSLRDHCVVSHKHYKLPFHGWYQYNSHHDRGYGRRNRPPQSPPLWAFHTDSNKGFLQASLLRTPDRE
jgi:hypothetical protein